MSKGSLRRPAAQPRAYAEGWKRVFGPTTKAVHMNTKRGQAGSPRDPQWVCTDCAIAAGGKMSRGIATWHNGYCDVCGHVKAITQPRDFGYPEFKPTH